RPGAPEKQQPGYTLKGTIRTVHAPHPKHNNRAIFRAHICTRLVVSPTEGTAEMDSSSGCSSLLSRRTDLPLPPRHALARHCSSTSVISRRLTISTEDCGYRWNRSHASRPSHNVCPAAYSTAG